MDHHALKLVALPKSLCTGCGQGGAKFHPMWLEVSLPKCLKASQATFGCCSDLGPAEDLQTPALSQLLP